MRRRLRCLTRFQGESRRHFLCPERARPSHSVGPRPADAAPHRRSSGASAPRLAPRSNSSPRLAWEAPVRSGASLLSLAPGRMIPLYAAPLSRCGVMLLFIC
ncbi:hypothetical protein NDU88_008423 [Pleurodeles waltl]|uniref:Uncharacterized protein n=1 Tax=Pleurodeles waltl TaxID=8319 RepID=A0AAV7PS33_PLEWA|nr:hypothetical protein NDU88_008423 [Pleurodeles waltl]